MRHEATFYRPAPGALPQLLVNDFGPSRGKLGSFGGVGSVFRPFLWLLFWQTGHTPPLFGPVRGGGVRTLKLAVLGVFFALFPLLAAF